MSANRSMKVLFCTGMMVLALGCGQIPLPNSATPSPQSPNDKATAWSNGQVVSLMQGLDEALDNMFIFLPAPTQTPSAENVNVTSACSGFFATNGNIVVGGTFNFGQNSNVQNSNAQNGNAQDTNVENNSFALTFTLNNCQLSDGSDPNTVNTYAAAPLTVQGSMTTSQDPNGVVTQKFVDNQITGTVNLTSDAGTIPCQVSLTNSVTYQWSNNLDVAGSWSGTICGQAETGSLTQNLPVVVP